jgi:hypothetical protein
MLDAATFRQQFPEFTDPGMYPAAAIVAWATLAYARLDAARWDAMLDYGVALMVAHYMALARGAAIAARSGRSVPGEVKGITTSKSVDKVSVSYDVNRVTIEGAGQWNLTRYGIELWQLMGQIGAGGIQVDSVTSGQPYGLPLGYFQG